MKAAIIGASGYGGVELVRLLANHPKVFVHSIHSSSQAGSTLQDQYPHLSNHKTLLFEDIDCAKIAREVDIVFTATPSGVSSNLTPQLLDFGVKVIDLSGDFRIQDPSLYEEWYDKPSAPKNYLEQAIYGLSEWNKDEVKSATVIANPGCYPTATLLGLAPLVRNSLIKESSIIIDAKSGVTGAGRNPSRATHFSETNENLKIYKVNQHQHIPEIEQVLSGWNDQVKPITFSTHLVPMTRGIMATIYAEASDHLSTASLLELYNNSYKNSPFVRIKENGLFPATKEVYGSNYCDIGITYDERTGRVTVVAVIDNLVKGAAGQAVQNVNIMMGIDERTGLDFIPVYP